MIKRLIASAFWFVSRWRLAPQPAPQRPTILIGAPHTSNWDFILMLAIAWKLGIRMRWLGKTSLFHGLRGPVMRALGGIAVDRESPGEVVGDLVSQLNDDKGLAIVITPDGTRGAHEYWKSGFYRLAEQTGLPLTLGYVDRPTMTTGLGPTFEVTGDVAADMARIREFYRDKSGFIPASRVEPRLRHEPGREPGSGPGAV
ncbi:MAG: 1-acyl-sn-glycerol-3-phosphate acyltransferase [Corynebacterium sp.]|uniref:1-acyl-sn-glycerol-3-phosphate acyltransferase n=2 Tax=Corynebacterium TaxID=1716 RepID=UPI0026487488|nr:1-acyl-sn-glycerol-3-phosphate acyltransferase [Corynebacterium sp.]MDN5582567.1 1-acyl-sn-glycerol-3-phosphate acyltransferase [Corynebacterium sp.]MDN5719773.1 1-acyl-sn-glycerol-3-phosphate acyltransferase [Corynebacterium sp.]MDN6324210.1 1-acyl-sn-glycerol-3-phosphate acyltransferase [Corynebacterium sp.]